METPPDFVSNLLIIIYLYHKHLLQDFYNKNNPLCTKTQIPSNQFIAIYGYLFFGNKISSFKNIYHYSKSYVDLF